MTPNFQSSINHAWQSYYIFLDEWFSNSILLQNHLESLEKIACWAASLRGSDSVGLGRLQEWAFRTDLKTMMIIPVQNPHFENHCPKTVSVTLLHDCGLSNRLRC